MFLVAALMVEPGTHCRPRHDIVSLLWAPKITTIQAPMVRYSRLPFRKLCANWGTDVSYTHMILAESFAMSGKVFAVCRVAYSPDHTDPGTARVGGTRKKGKTELGGLTVGA